MPDTVIFFGVPEFVTVLLGTVVVLFAAISVLWSRRVEHQYRRLVDGFPYPAILYREGKVMVRNTAAAGWDGRLELHDLEEDSRHEAANIVRTIPAVEGQSYQARALRLTDRDTLLLLEDLGATQRQQAFYRSFIQNVSHELKTPLTVIQGHIAKISAQPEDRQGWLASGRIVTEETKRLTQLVDNLLTLARLESPSFALDLEIVNLGALLEESILQLSEHAEQRKLEISLALPPSVPRLMADRPRLKQVILNLLDNAFKYTPAGGEVSVRLENDSANRRLICSVYDNGEGIPAEDLPFIFDKLYRARRTGGRPVEGSGLGLSLAEQIISAHGGEITVESKLGQGSTFTFSLPYEPAQG